MNFRHFVLALVFASIYQLADAQAPLSISYEPSGELNVNELSVSALNTAPKECVIDFHFSGPSVRVILESSDGSVNYLDKVFSLNVHTNSDSTWVAGKPGAWTVGLGQFTGLDQFRVKVLNSVVQDGSMPVVAEGTYP